MNGVRLDLLTYLLYNSCINLKKQGDFMARKPRIEYTGALYHVMCKGNNGEKVFAQDKQKDLYVKIITQYKLKYDFRLYAYCIMDTHVHLLLEMNSIPLSKIMQGIQQVYTQKYNKILDRTGHVFQQRYKAILCNKEKYLLRLIQYIHKNPSRAGMIQGLEYKWSSHIDYLRSQNVSITDTEFPLGLFSANEKQAVKKYLAFMNETSYTENIVDLYNETYQSTSGASSNDKPSISSSTNKEMSFEELLSTILNQEQLTINDVRIGGAGGSGIGVRERRMSNLRKVIILLARKYTTVNNQRLACALNIDPARVSRILSSAGIETTQFIMEAEKKFRIKSISQA